MEWLILVVQLIILASFGALVLFAKNYLPSYTKEKGKNLATKEDIKDITDKIESVKTEYAKELEGLKSQLNAKFHAQTVRFEKEFKVYEQLWATLLNLRNATLNLRPSGDSVDPNESEEDRRKRRLERFKAAFDVFYPTVYENKPFFPLGIFDHLDSLRRLITSESVDYSWRRDEPNERRYDPNYWEKARANADKIMVATDAICDLIRQRIERL